MLKTTIAGTTALDKEEKTFGRDIKLEKVDRFCGFDFTDAEKRGGWPVGKGERAQEDDDQAHGPQHEQDAPTAKTECFGVCQG